jgi:phosphoribosylformylglycinamidine synthase
MSRLALAPDEIGISTRISAVSGAILMSITMFAQNPSTAGKIFNADWLVDGTRQSKSLFAMIRHTHARSAGNGDRLRRQRRGDRGRRRFYPDATGRYAAHTG